MHTPASSESPRLDGAPGLPPAACKEIYLGIARQEPLPVTLSRIAALAERELPGAEVAVFHLSGDLLHAFLPPGAARLPASLFEGCPPHRAPWWDLRGALQSLRHAPEWAPFRSALAPFEWCWSDRILTPAGEIAGAIAAFFPGSHQPPVDRGRLTELAELAALAIEQANLLEELLHQAHHDAVTGLSNRRHFEEAAERWRSAAQAGARAALLLTALDGVHRVREILGEEIADQLLAAAAARLRASLRSSDLAARFSGDEIVVLASSVPDQTEAAALAARLLGLFSQPFEIRGHEIHLTPALGVSVVGSSAPPADWFRQARAALAAARRGRNGGRAVCFEPSMGLTSPEVLELEKRLRAALPKGELLLYYQPQIDARTFRAAGYEALMRWRDPDVGLVSPGLFIPLAEETGLITAMGRWALGEACRQARSWESRGLPARVGVNVSAVQFADPAFVQHVEEALAASGLTPRLLELEITESMLVENLTLAAARMQALQHLGVQFALDDFGTGSSSLAYLKNLPVQRIKIDRSFLAELGGASGAAPLLESIIVLAHNLNLKVIVEGVETRPQLDALLRLGADEMQGFLTGRPLPPAEAETAAVRPLVQTSDI